MDEMQFAQQQQQFDTASMMARTNYINTNQQDINTLLSELTDPEKDIIEIEQSLKGIEYDDNGNPTRVTQPLLNDKGVANMIRLVRSMLSRVTYVSNFEDEQIRLMVIELGDDIIDDLTFNKEAYEIKSQTAMSTILTIIVFKAFTAGMAALENGFRRFLKSGIIETTINTQGNQIKTGGKGGGGLSSLLGIGRK